MHHDEPPIETERLRLRPLTPGDVDPLLEVLADADTMLRPENVASCRVAEKLGMAIWKETVLADVHHYVYRLDRPT